MDFDIRWLSLNGTSADGLDEVVAAEQRASQPAPQDGRFDAMLAAHLQWAQSARSGNAANLETRINAVESNRVSRVQAVVQAQLQRIAGLESVS